MGIVELIWFAIGGFYGWLFCDAVATIKRELKEREDELNKR